MVWAVGIVIIVDRREIRVDTMLEQWEQLGAMGANIEKDTSINCRYSRCMRWGLYATAYMRW